MLKAKSYVKWLVYIKQAYLTYRATLASSRMSTTSNLS